MKSLSGVKNKSGGGGRKRPSTLSINPSSQALEGFHENQSYVAVDPQRHSQQLENALQKGGFLRKPLDSSAKDDSVHRRIRVFSSPGKQSILKSFVISDIRFEEEARNAEVLRSRVSTVLPRVEEINRIGKYVWYKNQFPEGITLSEIIKHPGNFTKELKYRLAIELIKALETLHRGNYTHGDIKPENILIGGLKEPPLRVQFIDIGGLEHSQQRRKLSSVSRFYLPLRNTREPFQVGSFLSHPFTKCQRQVLDRFALGRILQDIIPDKIVDFIINSRDEGLQLSETVSGALAHKPSRRQEV